MLAGDERAAVDLRRRMAGDRPLVGGRGRGLVGDRLRELAALGQLAVRERLLGPGRGRSAPLAAVSCARSTFQVSAARSISASRAAAAVRRSRRDMSGVVRLPNVPMSNGVNCVSAMTMWIELDRRVQLLGDGLGQRGADVLADLGLAGEDRDLAVLADVQPGADVLGRGAAAEPPPPTAAGLLRRGFGGVPVQQVEDEDAAAQRLQEVAAVELEPVGRALAQLVALGLDLGRCVDLGDDSGSARSSAGLLHRLRGRAERGDDPRIGAAPADIAIHVLDDLLPASGRGSGAGARRRS